jgi:hypothetical protein
VGPYVVYRAVRGIPLIELTEVTAGQVLALAAQLLQAVQSLHGLDFAHGDLAPHNILVEGRGDSARLTIVDLFDLAPVGDGRKRTLAYCPPDHETCGEKQVDRYAAALIAHKLLERGADERLQEPLRQLLDVVDSGGANLLDFPVDTILEAAAKLKAPPGPTFRLSIPGGPSRFFEDREFWVRRFSDAFVLTLDVEELTLRVSGGRPSAAHLAKPSRRSLEDASLNGVRVLMSLHVSDGEPSGLQELYYHLLTVPGLASFAAAPATTKAPDPASRAFPLREFWRRFIEVEDALFPELEITGSEETVGRGVMFPCERTRGDFDFDPLDTVDVFIGGRAKPVATLDLKALAEDSVTLLDEPDWPLKRGDRVRLVSRRSRQSFDRRRRAVERILRGESQIRDLIEYFDLGAQKEGIAYDITVEEEDLEPYKLNPGQHKAMLEVLGRGPIGLVQGPPGTGKTHFIAALVHWLTTKGGVEKVLLVSQSHEAVNAALEKLIDRFKAEEANLSMLRIGTKGIREDPALPHGLAPRAIQDAFRGRV